MGDLGRKSLTVVTATSVVNCSCKRGAFDDCFYILNKVFFAAAFTRRVVIILTDVMRRTRRGRKLDAEFLWLN